MTFGYQVLGFGAFPNRGVSGYTIENAAVFDGSDYLTRTPTSVGNTKTFTMSVWLKLANVAKQQIVCGAGDLNATFGNDLYFQSNGKLYWEGYHGAGNFDIKLQGADSFRDPGAWYNIICVYDCTPASPGSSTNKLIVNGTQLNGGNATFDAEAYPANSEDSVWNTEIEHVIGYMTTNGGSRHFEGYMADYHFVDGAALAATDFGEFDDNGVWVPIEYAGTAAAGSAVTVTHTASPVDASNATAYTFSSTAIGTAHANRRVVVGTAASTGTATVSSLTVGGVSATEIGTYQAATSTVSLWSAAVASGTSADIVVTWSGAQTRCGIGVYDVRGAAASAYTMISGNGLTSALSGTAHIPAGSVGIGVAVNSNSGGWTWAGLTEHYDETMEGGTYHSGASAAFGSEVFGQTISATQSAASDHGALVAILPPSGFAVGHGPNGFHLKFANSTYLGLDTAQGATTPGNVGLQLSFDGLDEADSTTDESSYGHTVSFVADAELDTAQYKHGTSSLLLDGTGDYITVPDHAIFDLTGNFTCEMWIRWSVTPESNSFGGSATDGATRWEWGYTGSNIELNGLEFLATQEWAILQTQAGEDLRLG